MKSYKEYANESVEDLYLLGIANATILTFLIKRLVDSVSEKILKKSFKKSIKKEAGKSIFNVKEFLEWLPKEDRSIAKVAIEELKKSGKLKTYNENVNESGDCYEAAFVAQQWGVYSKWTLVHGLPTLTGGDHAGCEYGHAWLENGDEVYDASSGKTIPKIIYYSVGNIKYTVKYSKSKARKLAHSTEHYGPWDKKIWKSLHN